eukprot:scaffold71042_cov32-Tisochrysis_lutea.AAC.5
MQWPRRRGVASNRAQVSQYLRPPVPILSGRDLSYFVCPDQPFITADRPERALACILEPMRCNAAFSPVNELNSERNDSMRAAGKGLAEWHEEEGIEFERDHAAKLLPPCCDNLAYECGHELTHLLGDAARCEDFGEGGHKLLVRLERDLRGTRIVGVSWSA